MFKLNKNKTIRETTELNKIIIFSWHLSCQCLSPHQEPQPTSASPEDFLTPLSRPLDPLWALWGSSDSDLGQLPHVLAPRVHSCYRYTSLSCENTHSLFRLFIDDHRNLICNCKERFLFLFPSCHTPGAQLWF